MAKYALGFMNDTLVVLRRRLFFFWTFNRSEEDQLNKTKNTITKLQHELSRQRRLLPKQEAELKARKDALLTFLRQTGRKRGPEWTDGFRWRKEPVKLIEEIKSGKKKRDRAKGADPPKPVVLAQLTTPTK